MSKETSIEKVQSGPLVIPDFLKEVHGAEGFEAMGRDDVILPRLVISQGSTLTPQRKRNHPSYIPGLGEGQLFNSVSEEVYGDRVELIPLLFSQSRIFFKTFDQGGGILCQSFNGIDGGSISPTCAECPNSQFGANGSAPPCSKIYSYPAVLLPSRELIVNSLKSMGLKAGKKWNARMKGLGGKPMYSAVYELQVTEQPSSKGSFFGPVITLKRFVTADEFSYAKAAFESIRGKVIVSDSTDAEDHNEGGGDNSVPF